MILTSPYHSKRLKLTWNKNFKNLNIFFPPVVDRKNNDFLWGLPFNQMKIIFYELTQPHQIQIDHPL